MRERNEGGIGVARLGNGKNGSTVGDFVSRVGGFFAVLEEWNISERLTGRDCCAMRSKRESKVVS